MNEKDHESHSFYWRNNHSANVTEIINFLEVSKGMTVLDIGGGDGIYSKEFLNKSCDVTLLDSYDYNFRELNSIGIKTILKSFCGYVDGEYDLSFTAHVYHDLVHSCKMESLSNLKKISRKFIAVLDFTKENVEFGPPEWLRLDKREVIEDMEKIGFVLKKEKDIPNQYILLFGRVSPSSG